MEPNPAAYYDLPRSEVVALVPPDARDVLDVGCGAGGLGRELKRLRPRARVRGIELVAEQAARAQRHLDEVFVGGFERDLPSHWPRPDCIVFADVLEHMVDPWGAVKRARALLHPSGTLVASIPNVAHASVISGLFRGRFEYQPDGILDRTHLRFFTRPSAIELIESGGFVVRSVRRNLDPATKRVDDAMKRPLARVLALEKTRGRLFRGPLASLADAVTIQFLIVAHST